MMQATFQYKAIDRDGAASKGSINAADRSDAYRQLAAGGLKPLQIKESGGKKSRRKNKVSAKELAHLTYQLSVLLEAHIPIVDGLEAIAEQESNERLREVLYDIARQITAGASVTDAISPHRELFGDIYVETVRAAEASGNMIDVLAHLAEMLDRNYEMTKNVKGAMMYPLCVIGALTLAVGFLMVFVVPRFTTMFASRGLELPIPTQIVVFLSDIIRNYWYVIIGGAIGGVWGLRHAWSNRSSRQKIDGFLHRIPYMRDILLGLAVSRFSHVFGVSLRSGLGLLDTLEMSGKACGRPLLQEDAEKMRDEVNVGGRLTDCFNRCSYMPGFARRMIAAGEEAGDLPRMFDIVARHYDREVQHLTKNVATIIEPIMIVGLAGVVLIIALAIFLPMWNMAALLG